MTPPPTSLGAPLAFAVTLCIATAAAFRLKFGPKQLSIQPEPVAFGIWSVIFIALALVSFTAFLERSQISDESLYLLTVANVCLCLWVVAYNNGWFRTNVVLLAGICVAAIVAGGVGGLTPLCDPSAIPLLLEVASDLLAGWGWIALILSLENATGKPLGSPALVPVGILSGTVSAVLWRPVLAAPTIWACMLQRTVSTESRLALGSAAVGAALAVIPRVFSNACAKDTGTS